MKAFVEFIFTNPYTMILRYAQFIAAIIIFAYMALMPFPPVVAIKFSDVVMHITGNTLLVLSAWLAIYRRVRLYQVLMLIILYSITIEYAQSFTTQRSANLFDAASNVTGIAIGFGICTILEIYLRRFRLKDYHNSSRKKRS